MRTTHATLTRRYVATMVLVGALSVGAALQAATLDPLTIPKYTQSLIIPPVMPSTSTLTGPGGENIDYYEIAVKQFQQQILPPTDAGGLPTGLPVTTVWSYGSINHPGTFNYPAFTVEAITNQPTRVKWINGLVDANGNYLPHLLPVDQTLHWANPPGGIAGRDKHGTDPTPYTGPVPIVTHVHGSHVGPESDGYPEAWWLPDAINIPAGYATKGTKYDQFDRTNTQSGTAVYQYANDQRASTIWYHDHSLGMTRTNVYAGPAGFWLIRGGPADLPEGVLPGPAPKLGDAPGIAYHEIPIVIQDRTFNQNGSLFYPDNRAFFEGLLPSQLQIPFIPNLACGRMPSDISPIWNPEFFGNVMVVNGRAWPTLTVEPRRYRFRFLNGCDSRTLILRLVTGDPTVRPAATAIPFWIIGSDGGFLPAPLRVDTVLDSLAERYDTIVDFTGLPVGTAVYLINEAPDAPYSGGVPGVTFPFADPNTSGQVMKFVIGPLTGPDTSADPATGGLVLPTLTPLGEATNTRRVSLNELDSKSVLTSIDANGNVVLDCLNGLPFGPQAAMLGTVTTGPTGMAMGMPMMWMDAITENPLVNTTEVWEIHNFTMDGHPIHLHLVMFQVVNREDKMTGVVSPPEPWETGFKDTVIAYPDQITRVKARFDKVGLYVWHCHILSHEDNEMMRPYEVLPFVAPDMDRDGDVDTNDFQWFYCCFNGPNRPPKGAGCGNCSFDGDIDVDLADFSRFMSCFNGTNRPPACNP